ncbi:MAG: hypothetical protein QXF56_00945 [Candidatus Micrarchaeia archaeon]
MSLLDFMEKKQAKKPCDCLACRLERAEDEIKTLRETLKQIQQRLNGEEKC